VSDYTLQAGDLATYDTFLCGLLPVKVLRFYYPDDEPRTEMVADVKVTAVRTAYRRGEVLHAVPVGKVLHRRQIYTNVGRYRIRGQAHHVLSEGMPRHDNGTRDLRYTVKGNRQTADCTRWTARFCGEWIGWSASKDGAEKLARDHSEGN